MNGKMSNQTKPHLRSFRDGGARGKISRKRALSIFNLNQEKSLASDIEEQLTKATGKNSKVDLKFEELQRIFKGKFKTFSILNEVVLSPKEACQTLSTTEADIEKTKKKEFLHHKVSPVRQKKVTKRNIQTQMSPAKSNKEMINEYNPFVIAKKKEEKNLKERIRIRKQRLDESIKEKNKHKVPNTTNDRLT